MPSSCNEEISSISSRRSVRLIFGVDGSVLGDYAGFKTGLLIPYERLFD